jgi:hypothetical protein
MSPRPEQSNLGYVAQGLFDGEIAEKLCIAQNTVRNHVSAIYGRLGVYRQSAVAVWARELGLEPLLKPLVRQPNPDVRREAQLNLHGLTVK